MARKVTIELTSDEDIKLRSYLEDIRDGAKILSACTFIPNDNDRVNKIGENILLFLDEIQRILDY